MGEVYKMTIAGCERELPICPISDTLDIFKRNAAAITFDCTDIGAMHTTFVGKRLL